MTEPRLAQTEKALQESICQLLAIQGWEVFEFARIGARPKCPACGAWAGSVRGNPEGWVDVVAVKRGQHLYLEVKAQRGSLSPMQKIMRMRMQQAGMKCYVVRSVEEVMEVLAGMGWGCPRCQHSSLVRDTDGPTCLLCGWSPSDGVVLPKVRSEGYRV